MKLSKLLTTGVSVWVLVVALSASTAATLALGNVLRQASDSAQPQAQLPERTATTSATPSVTETYEVEYRKLAMLRGGLSLAYFEQVLGVPLFVTGSRDGKFTQSLFRGPDYWVQAISDTAGAVQLMAVTSCTADFHPRFGGNGDPSRVGQPVVLNQTRMAEAGSPGTIHYFASGATANSYYYDEYYEGNPGNYITHFVGIDDACPATLPQGVITPFSNAGYEHRRYDSTDPVVAQFRAGAVANTYAESGVFLKDDVLTGFQIGADRILTRTAPPLAAAPASGAPRPQVTAPLTETAPTLPPPAPTPTPIAEVVPMPAHAPRIVDAPIVDAQIEVVINDDFEAYKSHNQVTLSVTSQQPTTCTEFESGRDRRWLRHQLPRPRDESCSWRPGAGLSGPRCDAFGQGVSRQRPAVHRRDRAGKRHDCQVCRSRIAVRSAKGALMMAAGRREFSTSFMAGQMRRWA